MAKRDALPTEFDHVFNDPLGQARRSFIRSVSFNHAIPYLIDTEFTVELEYPAQQVGAASEALRRVQQASNFSHPPSLKPVSWICHGVDAETHGMLGAQLRCATTRPDIAIVALRNAGLISDEEMKQTLASAGLRWQAHTSGSAVNVELRQRGVEPVQR